MSGYRINEIFYSLQGEGFHSGSPNIFLRFAACNLSCSMSSHGFNCDTHFNDYTEMTGAEILQHIRSIGGSCRSVFITGGEPLLQLDGLLCEILKGSGYYVAVETNGTMNPTKDVLQQLDWIACCPKVAEDQIQLKRCDELKYVRTAGQPLAEPKLLCSNRFVSPAFDGDKPQPGALQWCIELVLKNPGWRLSTQQHKCWGIR